MLKSAKMTVLFLSVMSPLQSLADQAPNENNSPKRYNNQQFMGGGDVGDVCRGNSDCRQGLICTSRDAAGNGFCQGAVLPPLPPITPPSCN